MSGESSRRPGVSLLASQPGREPAAFHRGLANLEHEVPVTASTAFNVGSVAKQITAYLAVTAARDGLIGLDRDVTDLLPRFKIQGVSVAELITHMSGIRDAESLMSLAGLRDLDHFTANDLLSLAYRQDRRAAANGRFLYSNTNYILLAEILESAYGTTLNDAAYQRLFKPLGMTSTQFKTDPRQVIPSAANAYTSGPTGWQRTETPVAIGGSGSLWTTTSDLNRWLGHLHHSWRDDLGRFPGQATLAYVPSDRAPYLYGPGLYADPRPTMGAVFHYGHEQGFSAATYLSAKGNRLICSSNDAGLAADHVLANVRRQLWETQDGFEQDLFDRAVTTASEHREETPAVAANDGGCLVHHEVGVYVCDQVPGRLRLTRSGDDLHLWRRGTSERLVPTGDGRYAGNGYTIRLSEPTFSVSQFILDLDRAPSLTYDRQP